LLPVLSPAPLPRHFAAISLPFRLPPPVLPFFVFRRRRLDFAYCPCHAAFRRRFCAILYAALHSRAADAISRLPVISEIYFFSHLFSLIISRFRHAIACSRHIRQLRLISLMISAFDSRLRRLPLRLELMLQRH